MFSSVVTSSKLTKAKGQRLKIAVSVVRFRPWAPSPSGSVPRTQVTFHSADKHFWSEGICQEFKPASLIIEVSQIKIREADEPSPFFGFTNARRYSRGAITSAMGRADQFAMATGMDRPVFRGVDRFATATGMG